MGNNLFSRHGTVVPALATEETILEGWDGTRGNLVQIRMLNPALLLETRVPLSPNTNAATLVLSLVQLVLQQPLEQNQQETQNERGQDESNVCFNISFLK